MSDEKHESRAKKASPGIFLIGLGVVWLLNVDFWPSILLVIAATGMWDALAGGKPGDALQVLLWMGGLAVLFTTGLFWPGILVLIGVSIVIGALFSQADGDKPKGKPKRGVIVGDDGEMEFIDTDQLLAMDDDRQHAAANE